MSFYESWGFSANPFNSYPLVADDLGNRLLIGREKSIKDLIQKIKNPPRIPTIEGGIGAGKTSIVNVATYRLTKDFLLGKEPELYIACSEQFQISSLADISNLEERFYFAAAQTLISLNEEKYCFKFADSAREKLETWLNSPTKTNVQLGLNASAFGVTLGGGDSINTSSGYDRSGFRKAVRDWLHEVFGLGGGIVCIIDNLELLQESSEARRAIDGIRDSLLATIGTRWVLCGANGIMQGVCASPRLSRRLHTPIIIERLEDQYIPDVYQSRLEAFSKFAGSAHLPLTVDAFQVLYEALDKNLGNLIAAADEYCQWASLKEFNDTSSKILDDTFYQWFYDDIAQIYAAARGECKPRSIEVLDAIVAIGGNCSPGDFEKFGFKSQQVMRAHVKELEDVGLIESIQDDKDQRRKSIQVTSKGFKAFYHRCKVGVSRTLEQVRDAVIADSVVS